MSDDQTSAESARDDADQPATGTSSAMDTQSAMDSTSLEERYAKARKDATKLLRQVHDLQAKVDAAESAKLSDLERLQRERDQAVTERDHFVQQWRHAVAQSALSEAARQAGAVAPRAVWRLVDAEGLEIDEQGRVTNLDDVLATVKATYPELFRGPGSADGGAGGRTDGLGKVDINAALRQLSGRSG